jgi:acetoin:2,6-dichlorophenolindophenol oxidoreductase subunit alpha
MTQSDNPVGALNQIGELSQTIILDSNILVKQLPHEKLKWMLEKMYQTRYFEEKAEELYTRGLVHGTMHLSIGMEASPVGSIAALEPEDIIIHHHRGHGHTIAKGADIIVMMGEFLGKEPGYCRGRGGSMHIANVPAGNMGATGIVGGGIPIAVGIGLALQMRKSRQVLLSYFGDGSTNEGAFHEALNLASVWCLPIVFICDNNKYGMSMDFRRSMNVEYISTRAASYGIPGISIDGNDVLFIYQVTSQAIERARSGKGPTLVENVTYRWRGHSKSDRNLYRTQNEIEDWMKRCPIKRFEQLLITSHVMSKEEIEEIDRAANQTIDEAANKAILMPEPTSENMEDEVFAP